MNGLIHKTKGKIKQAVGALIGNSELEREGVSEQREGQIEGVVEDAKRAVKGAVKDAFKDGAK